MDNVYDTSRKISERLPVIIHVCVVFMPREDKVSYSEQCIFCVSIACIYCPVLEPSGYIVN